MTIEIKKYRNGWIGYVKYFNQSLYCELNMNINNIIDNLKEKKDEFTLLQG